ncbi:DUF2726 domain-containing protein [Paraglaciecola aquimarina]|uniref:DUF2726 domain-containing protein n=1 Tax=Paraglaciecola aquimarina TaxID=1235557 RepID=A0ABU3SS68_9ALTE|nr:DUF2726 domain-containing protein [Paraglaciecola aquimarina]MDU0352865.1 DUF2726 domain-containing protein [Paraglaciecola aquimarina]
MELAIILMMLLIIVAVGAMKLHEPALGFPFQKKTHLFTAVERSFIDLIENAVGRDFRILCRVKMSDVLAVRKTADKKTVKNALSKAGSKQFDFVLCSKDTMTPLLAIDLVHSNGKDGYKNQRDYFVNGALDAARIPHIRIKVKAGYTVKDIQECIYAKLPKQKQAALPLLPRTANLASEFATQARPTRPIKTNKTVPRPVAAA